MDKIPDFWPPETETDVAARKVVPLFPLPHVFLLPGTIMPLHIFEPRYRDMIEDSLDGPGHIVIANVDKEHHPLIKGNPPVHRIAGLGEIARHDRLPEGRFMIWLAGLARVRINEVDSEHTYRMVEVEPLLEIEPQVAEQEPLRDEIESAIRERTSDDLNLPEGISLGQLVDLLLLKMPLPPVEMREIYSCPEIAERARIALAEHRRRPVPPEEESE